MAMILMSRNPSLLEQRRNAVLPELCTVVYMVCRCALRQKFVRVLRVRALDIQHENSLFKQGGGEIKRTPLEWPISLVGLWPIVLEYAYLRACGRFSVIGSWHRPRVVDILSSTPVRPPVLLLWL